MRGRKAAEPSEDLDTGPDADPESVARKILLDQLTGRARTRSELADKLASRNVPDDVATRLLDRFEEVGLIDDAAFAREWVAQRQSGRGLARRALAQELRRKGIDDEVAREVLDDVDDEDEVEAARRLVQAKLRSVRSLDRDKAVRRLVGMLARKGHSSSVAFRVVKEELDLDLEDTSRDDSISPPQLLQERLALLAEPPVLRRHPRPPHGHLGEPHRVVDVLLARPESVAAVGEDRQVARLVDRAVARVGHQVPHLADHPVRRRIHHVPGDREARHGVPGERGHRLQHPRADLLATGEGPVRVLLIAGVWSEHVGEPRPLTRLRDLRDRRLVGRERPLDLLLGVGDGLLGVHRCIQPVRLCPC